MHNRTATKGTATKQYLPVYLDTLRVDSVLEFDLYIDNGSDVVLYRAAKLAFTEQNRRQLLENRVTRLYVSQMDR